MNVRSLFNVLNTDIPRIIIMNQDNEPIYEKKANFPIVRLDYWESEVSWIYQADSELIYLKIE